MTVLISPQSSTGWKNKADFPLQLFLTRINMRDTVPRFASVYGVCVTIAILLTTGCSTVQRTPMAFADLDHFKINCKKKGEQIAFLQSMRPTNDEKLFAGLSTIFQPWNYIVDPYGHDSNRAVSTGRSEWVINQLLMELRDNC
jgi:hypothetical protein